jgi:hypothetical protein
VRCNQCESVGARRARRVLPEGGTEPPTPVRGLLCEHCGTVLPANETDDHLLRRLEQLARFGLGASSAPLLSREWD